jgi:hypothetical protein
LSHGLSSGLAFSIQLLLAATGSLLLQLGLDFGPLGALLGDGRLGAALLGALAVVPGVVVASLLLGMAKLTPLALTPRHGNDDGKHDEGADDYRDDRKR